MVLKGYQFLSGVRVLTAGAPPPGGSLREWRASIGANADPINAPSNMGHHSSRVTLAPAADRSRHNQLTDKRWALHEAAVRLWPFDSRLELVS